MHHHVEWLASVAADPRLSHLTVRLAVAAAGMAGDKGRYRGRLIALASAAQMSSRYAPEVLKGLADRGYLLIHLCKNGRVDIEIITPRDEQAPAGTKTCYDITGAVVGVVMPKVPHGHSKKIIAYVDAGDRMAKLTIGREDAEKIAQAVSPQPA